MREHERTARSEVVYLYEGIFLIYQIYL